MRLGDKHRTDRQRHMAGYRIAHQRTAAFVRHVQPVNPAALAEQRHRQMPQTARADGAVADVLLGLGRRHHIGEGLVLRADVGGQHHRRGADQDHGAEVLAGVERQVGYQAGIDTMGVEHHAEGIAISRCGGDRRSTDGARGAPLVFDNDALAQLLGQHWRQNPRHLIHRATGRKHRHQLDGLSCRPCARGRRYGLGRLRMRLRQLQPQKG